MSLFSGLRHAVMSMRGGAGPPAPPVPPARPRPAGRPGGIAPGSGARMSAVLTADDLRAQGLRPERETPDVNADGADSIYCTWTEAAGAQGGIELDVWYPAGDPRETFSNAIAEAGGGLSPAGLPGADESLFDIPGPDATFAGITVRARQLVFSLAIPNGPRAQEQLLYLSAIVLARLAP